MINARNRKRQFPVDLDQIFKILYRLRRAHSIKKMAAHVQDVFMLFGDSITEGGWEPNYNGFGQRLTRMWSF